MSQQQIKWPQLIRKHVFELIMLYIILILISVVFITWQRSSSNELRQVANNYHLASSYHFLKALEEIRHLEYHFAYNQEIANSKADIHATHSNAEHDFNLGISFYLIQQEILASLKLHSYFADKHFDTLTNKLQQSLDFFKAGNQIWTDSVTFEQVSGINLN